MTNQLLARLQIGDLFWRRVVQPRLFQKNAENAHTATVALLKQMQNKHMLGMLRYFYRSPVSECKNMDHVLPGIFLCNVVGLAAGFDKQAEIIAALDALGFGSIEVGTVTPVRQYGNDLPRVFRYPERRAIINRYGFNSVGAPMVAENLRRTFLRYGRCGIHAAVGVSLGKNKCTPDEEAVKDYVTAYRAVRPHLRRGDYIKINISSPNTPGLRAIFNRLDEFLAELVDWFSNPFDYMLPLVLKVPPDGLTPADYVRVVETAARRGFVAIEATNTTTDEAIKARWGLSEAGGLSGEPLRERSLEVLRAMKDAAKANNIRLIGVGGISHASHALEKRRAGAVAVQCYTGLVFRGPILIHEILEAWQNK